MATCWRPLVVLAIVPLAGCATPLAGHSARLPTGGSACAQQQAQPGAAASLGLDARGVSAPLWSAQLGFAEAAGSGRLFAAQPGGCVTAVDAASGKQVWSWAARASSPVMGLVAGPQIVLVATGHTHGHPPAMVYAATDRLVALDPGTGTQRWALPLPDDGQGVPAVIAADRVVVAEADGSVIGVDTRNGARRWADQPARGCTAVDMPAGFVPLAVLLPGAPAATVGYQCAGRQQLARIDPVSGVKQWTRSLPAGWLPAGSSPGYQSSAGTASGVIGLIASGRGTAVAPVVSRSSVGPGPGYETASVVAVDATSGKPLWQVDGVPVSAGVYGGAGQLCVASGFGVACHAAASGSISWQWRPPVTPSGGGPAGSIFDTVVTNAGRLYLTAPTEAARSIPAGSTSYRSPPGTFRLDVIDMASGRVLAATPLPAFYGGPSQVVVSADRSPPGVVAVSGSEVFVSPQLHETQVIEAFALA